MLRSLFVFAILIPGIAAALTSRFAALQLYLWFALFRPQEWIWWDISSLRPSLVLGLLLVVPCVLSGILPFLGHPLSVGAIVFLVSALLGQIDAVNPATGWYWIDYLFRLLLVCLLAISMVSDQKKFRITLAVIAASFGFHASKAGLASLLGGGVRFFDGLGGAFYDNNGYAVGMAMIAPLLIGAGQNIEHRWIRRGFYLAALLTAVAVISTFSRGGFLALVAGALTLALMHRRRAAAMLAIIVVAVPFSLFMSMQEGYLDRLSTIRTYEETGEESALSRLHFWRVAVDMALSRPLGIGLFNYESAYDDYDSLDGQFGRQRSVHSSHFQVLAETGFLGLATYVALFVCAYLYALRVRRRGSRTDLSQQDGRLFVTSANALLASMTAFLVGGSFVAMALNDLTWLTFALIASLDRISAQCCETAELPVRALRPPHAHPVSPIWRQARQRTL